MSVPPHRAVAIAAVLALHLLLIWLLLRATYVVITPPPLLRELPITLWLAPAEKPKPPKPQDKEKKEGETAVPHAITAPLSPPEGAPPTSDYNGLRALGRYMNNCSAGHYEALSQRELAHCLGNQWNEPGQRQGRLRLGKESDSIWKRQMDKKRAPAAPMEHECPLGSKNDQLGLPCFFGN
ncbi:MAG: hypothetical protein KGR48_10385 [Alphaproteobacteria bacterium]|nr:hypothetical protein [Alphaproteobacteria bacterium]MBU6472832.1 hypothetical protein [Alphaproteobacteria bacterium]MDE2011917.1 hypothetical protein [Alphaproteobacteria bacterium]MDE2072484.1 hypothetical protein [Alphaproteobacteria bacterium]